MTYDLFLQQFEKQQKSKGFSQQKLGEKVGLTRGQINNIEKGRSSLKVDIYFKMCQVLNISAEELMNPFAVQNEYTLLLERISRLSKRDFNIIKDLVMLLELNPQDL